MKLIRRAIAASHPPSVPSNTAVKSVEPPATTGTELVLCIPGPWTDRSDFLRQVIMLEPKGRYMFAGMLLADIAEKDHVPLDFCKADALMLDAFEIAGQGRISPEVLREIQDHRSVVYLHFPANFFARRERVLKFSKIIQLIGGVAVKVESTGVAHTWERWNTLLAGSPFEQYVAAVTLIGDADFYYSCGMHNFGLPDCEVPTTLDLTEAADLMNRFNFWRLVEPTDLQNEHTFSVAADAPHYRMHLVPDVRHTAGELFFNPSGLWQLRAI